MTNIDSVCNANNGPYAINNVVQASTQINYVPGKSKEVSITQFSASTLCGSASPVFKYSAYDDTNREPLPSLDCISVSPTSGAFTISTSCLAGTRVIKVVGELQSGQIKI